MTDRKQADEALQHASRRKDEILALLMVLIQLLLPMTGPAGTDMVALLAQTRRELVEAFSGVTAYVRSPAKGAWIAPEGHEEADDVVMVEVVAEKFDRRWWKSYAERLAHRFGQESIHVRSLPIELLDDRSA